MALQSAMVLSMLIASGEAALSINCPILDCSEESDTMVPGVCFEHDGSVPTKKLQGRLCWDAETEKKQPPAFCPFYYLDAEYEWIDENLQNQEGKDLNMHGK